MPDLRLCRQHCLHLGTQAPTAPGSLLALPDCRSKSRRRALAPLAAQVVHELFKHAATTKPAVSAALGLVSNDQLYRHTPRLSDVVNMLFIVAAAFGSCAILAAKYVYESGLRKEQYLRESTAELPPVHLLFGVDVTGSKYLGRPEVVRAADFAAAAHAHQRRRTGEPYVSHCIATAKIVEGLIASSRTQVADERAETAVIAALLHDVADDTTHDLAEIRDRFGSAVADIVHHVSRLSDVNQLLRRQLRHETVQQGRSAHRLSHEEEEALTAMILSLVDEPLVLAVKLADRLHNMRTCHVLKPDRRSAVATETLQVWCGLAERLGMFSLKAELEDLSFAVLQPQEYRRVRCQLDNQWGIHTLSPSPQKPTVTPQKKQLAPGKPADKALQLGKPPAKLQPPCSGGQTTAAAQPLSEVFFSFDQLRSLSRDGRADESPLSLAPASGISTPLPQLDQVRTDDQGRATESSSGCATAVLSPPASLLRPSEASAGVPMDKGLIARFRGPIPVKIGSSQELEQARRMGVILSPGFDPAVLPGLSIGKQRRPLTSKYARTQQKRRCSPLALPPAKQAAPAAAAASKSAQATASSAPAVAGAAPGGSAAGFEAGITHEQRQVGELLASVAPFDACLPTSPQRMTPTAWPAMKALEECAFNLGNELRLSNVAIGLDLDVQGRLKSAYSVHRKMQRKKVPLSQVYDARALRILIDDEHGAMMQDAVEACYEAMRVVQRLWKAIPTETDDYIANPSASGYQSLHTAVKGPGGTPMEVQIRTSSMHLTAEYGAAAHWAYKDSAAAAAAPAAPANSRKLQVGQPVMRSDGGRLQLGAIISMDSDVDQHSLLIAVENGSRLLPGARIPDESCRWLLAYVAAREWDHAGAGDWNVRLESCVLCNDGKFHVKDRFGRRQRATATPIHGWPSELQAQAGAPPAAAAKPSSPAPKWIGQLNSPQDELDVREVLSRNRMLAQPDDSASDRSALSQQGSSKPAEQRAVTGAPRKTKALARRSRLWRRRREEQDRLSSENLAYANILPAPRQKGNAAKIRSLRQKLENTPVADAVEDAARAESLLSHNISVFVFPSGKVASLPRGTTAGQVLSSMGAIQICEDGLEASPGLVNVNNKLVPDGTPLQNGDYVVLTRHLINISRS